jgi:long-chain acyl-CoA synthetase
VISGPTISPGYWSRPELTAQVFRNDAFWTGDVGHLDHGCLVVEGRKGDDGKLLNGEKVSSQEIVEEFFANPMIQYVVPEFLNRPNVTALLFLNEPAAHAFLAQQGELSAPGSVESLATNKLIEAAVQAQIARINEKVGQKGQWKRIRQFRIVPTTPTTENRLLSGKGEISAKVAKKVYADLIEGMYP